MYQFTKYKSHKTVEAFKISSIELRTMSGALLFADDNPEGYRVNSEFMERHKPEVGGYFVKYEDGYESYSPEKPFEEGYAVLTESSPAPANAPKFTPPPISDEQLENWFCYHAPTPEQIPIFGRINEIFLTAAKELRDLSPVCADQTAAFRELRMCRMAFNGTVACNPTK